MCIRDSLLDVESIELSLELFRRLGLSNLEVLVNSCLLYTSRCV